MDNVPSSGSDETILAHQERASDVIQRSPWP